MVGIVTQSYIDLNQEEKKRKFFCHRELFFENMRLQFNVIMSWNGMKHINVCSIGVLSYKCDHLIRK